MRTILVLAIGLAAVPAVAQQPAPQPAPTYCNVQIDTARRSRYVRAPDGNYDTFAGGGFWAHCAGEHTTMYSDSVAYYPERDLLYLLGRVRFQDTASVLNADRVTYYTRQERLYAEGHVYTKNLHSGSDLRGPNLDYYRAAPPIRDTLELYATGRPTIHFHSARRDSAPPAAPTDTEAFVVVADRTHMRGNDQMWGGGHVTVDRSDVAARGDSAQLDLSRNVGALVGGTPVVDGTGKDAYHLTGKHIRFALTENHEIRQVVSSGDALARGPDWRLAADTLDMALDSGKVQRAQAWGKTKRPDAVSGVQTIVADSLDIHMPAQIVRLVWAYGRARTTSRDTTARDTTVVRAPPPASRDSAGHDSTAARGAPLFRGDEDWLTGDSLRADFGVVTDSSGARKSELDHLTAFGSARALYHVSNDEHPEQAKGVNYARARRIDIAMRQSKVSTVDFVGKTDGVYLEPLPPPKPDSTAADSLRRAGADTTRAAAPDTTRHPPVPTDTTKPRPSRP